MTCPIPAAGSVALLLALAAIPAGAHFAYPGCAPAQAADFAVVPLAANSAHPDLQEPIKLALHPSPQGNVDVYFTQRYGKVRRYNGDTRTLTTLMDLAFGSDSVSDGYSEGLVGIALDPAFASNRWVYLSIGIGRTWRVSRFTLAGDRIDRGSERVILRAASTKISKHVSGPIRFDHEGNLWVAMGDDESRFTAANTSSMLGKILRIRPRPFPDNQSPAPGRGATYDIPSGNLFPPGTEGALPEIYVMGVRNPYSLALDPVRKAVAWGDVGPDNFSGGSTNPREFTEEHNLTAKPGNFGWPYWAGDNITLDAAGGIVADPVNNRPDGGLRNLPPAIPALHPFARAAAIAGPIYRFDASNPSTVKFPPHFDGAWFVADMNRSWIDAKALDGAGTRITGSQRVVGANPGLVNPLDLDFGPDGAMYVVNYQGYRTFGPRTGILRIEYRGACRVPVAVRMPGAAPGGVSFAGGAVRVDLEGPVRAEVRDLAGRIVWSREARGPFLERLGGRLAPGLHVLTVRHGSGSRLARWVR